MRHTKKIPWSHLFYSRWGTSFWVNGVEWEALNNLRKFLKSSPLFAPSKSSWDVSVHRLLPEMHWWPLINTSPDNVYKGNLLEGAPLAFWIVFLKFEGYPAIFLFCCLTYTTLPLFAAPTRAIQMQIELPEVIWSGEVQQTYNRPII